MIGPIVQSSDQEVELKPAANDTLDVDVDGG